MECTFPDNITISAALRSGMLLLEVVHYLRKNNFHFLVFSADEQTLDITNLDAKQIHKLGPVAVIIVSKLDGGKGIVQGRELLTIQFDKNEQLVSLECEKRYIGP